MRIPDALRTDPDKWNRESLNHLLKEEAWRAELGQPVPILRVWGATGLFWALLVDRLEQSRRFSLLWELRPDSP
jgi:hypothetical protein